MRSSRFSQFYIFTLALCILPVYGAWFYSPKARRAHGDEYVRDLGESSGETASYSNIASSTSEDYTHPAPSTSVIFPKKKYQGMRVTSIVPVYEVCPISAISASESQSCSTAYKTVTTSYCSTVLTGFFTKITVTDCKQEITFSTQTSYILATATGSAEGDIRTWDTGATTTALPTPVTHIQKVVSYYISPWEAVAAGKLPSKITVKVCSTDESGIETCETTAEVWKVHVEYVQVTSTRSISISESFISPVSIGFFDAAQEITAPAGRFDLTTEIGVQSRSAKIGTSTARWDDGSGTNTRTETSTHTRTITGPARTVTKTISEISTVDDSTTTLTSTVRITSTITIGGAAAVSSDVQR